MRWGGRPLAVAARRTQARLGGARGRAAGQLGGGRGVALTGAAVGRMCSALARRGSGLEGRVKTPPWLAQKGQWRSPFSAGPAGASWPGSMATRSMPLAEQNSMYAIVPPSAAWAARIASGANALIRIARQAIQARLRRNGRLRIDMAAQCSSGATAGGMMRIKSRGARRMRSILNTLRRELV